MLILAMWCHDQNTVIFIILLLLSKGRDVLVLKYYTMESGGTVLHLTHMDMSAQLATLLQGKEPLVLNGQDLV
jgi:hypothetical protein